MPSENLEKHTGIKGHFKHLPKDTLDAERKVDLMFTDGKETFMVEAKPEIRNYQLPQIIGYANRVKNLIVIAEHIFPKIKNELRKKNIAWLDGAGNIFLHTAQHHVWIEGHKREKDCSAKTKPQAFTPAGLKMVYLILTKKDTLYDTYRAMADKAGIALGNTVNVMNGLFEQKFMSCRERHSTKND